MCSFLRMKSIAGVNNFSVLSHMTFKPNVKIHESYQDLSNDFKIFTALQTNLTCSPNRGNSLKLDLKYIFLNFLADFCD